MRFVKTLLFLSLGHDAVSQLADTSSRLAATYFSELKTIVDSQTIWKQPLYGSTLLVDPQSRTTYANQPDREGLLRPESGIYKGILPANVMVANTAVTWQGTKWAVILWPLPTDRDQRLNLLVHESFHRIQDQLGLPASSPTADHLSKLEGRIYFLLELNALAAALVKPVAERAVDLANALLFRQKRRLLFPETFSNEQILDMNEGLAEYTGVVIARPPKTIKGHLEQLINSAPQRKSLIRSFAYLTGPIYGYLLYEIAPAWTNSVTASSDFAQLIEKYYQVQVSTMPTDDLLTRLATRYKGDAIIPVERKQEEERKQLTNQYTELFTRKPVLVIQAEKMNINFNPNNLFDLGELGTVYPTAEIKDSWGHLLVSTSGILLKDWKTLTLPVSESIDKDANELAGSGWQLKLNETWRVVQTDQFHYSLVRKE